MKQIFVDSAGCGGVHAYAYMTHHIKPAATARAAAFVVLRAHRGGTNRPSRCLSSTSSRPPSDFGARDGSSITNKGSVLQDVDAVLGHDRPADLEVLLTDHSASFCVLRLLSAVMSMTCLFSLRFIVQWLIPATQSRGHCTSPCCALDTSRSATGRATVSVGS